jgi:uncharacterized protein YbaP (TraB family)
MGTMHVGDERAYSYAQKACDLIDSTDLFLNEVDLNALLQGGMNLMLPDGTTLEDLLGHSYNKYSSLAQKAFGVDLDRLKHMLPLVVLNIISESALSKTYPISLDQHLWQYAQSQSVNTGGLESIEEHAATLEAISIADQTAMLKAALGNVEKFRKKIIRLSDLYSEAKIHELYKLSKKDLGAHKRVLLFDRNTLMAERCSVLHQEKSVFAAVGAAHLSGELGVLHLMKRRGFQVDAI